MGNRLLGKAAVVTGAGRGIGRAVALGLAAEGAKVVVNDIGAAVDGSGSSQRPAEEVVGEIKRRGGDAVANFDDVTDFQAASRIVETAIKSFGRIDILINNAGIAKGAPIWEMDPETWDRVVKVHLKGTFNCTRHAAPLMKAQGYGRIVNVSSPAGLMGTAGQSNYGAAKAAVFGFTNVAARDLGTFGVNVNCIAPSGTETRLSHQMIDEMKRDLGVTEEEIKRRVPKMIDPEDVAAVVLFLCTDEAADINGQVFAPRGETVGIYQPLTVTKSIFKQGRWTVDELAEIFPRTLGAGLPNPAPAQPAKAAAPARRATGRRKASAKTKPKTKARAATKAKARTAAKPKARVATRRGKASRKPAARRKSTRRSRK